MSYIKQWPTHSKKYVRFNLNKNNNFFFTENASRYCKADGVWAGSSDYMNCKPLESIQPYQDPSIVYTSYFYYGGYTISLVALVAAVSIFIYFK